MKTLNKKWMRFMGAVFFAMTLNFNQTCYATTQAEHIKLSRFTSLNKCTTRLYTNDTLGTDTTLPYNNGTPELYWPIKIPIVHAYDPYNLDTSRSLPEFSLTAQLAPVGASTIPSSQIKTELASHGITAVDRFIVIQNNSWIAGTPILFRPQPWLQPEASNASLITHTSSILAYYAPIEGSFAGIIGNGAVTTHPGDLGADGKTMMIFSGPDYAISALSFNTTHRFYTVCIETATTHSDGTVIAHTTPRAAITLHILCKDVDHDLIRGIIENYDADSLKRFFETLILPPHDAMSADNLIIFRDNYYRTLSTMQIIPNITSLEDFFGKLDAGHIDTAILRGFTEGATPGIIPN